MVAFGTSNVDGWQWGEKNWQSLDIYIYIYISCQILSFTLVDL